MKIQSFAGIQIQKNATQLDTVIESIQRQGFYVWEQLFPLDILDQIRSKMDVIWDQQVAEFGSDFLKKRGEFGQVRCMMAADKLFLDLIIWPELNEIVEQIIGESAILHLQNGQILFPELSHNQSQYHRDFAKNFTASICLSLNALIAVDDFTPQTGGTWVVPGSHLFDELPSQAFIQANKVQLNCPAGSLILFDSLLVHRGGTNRSNSPRRAINHQFTKPFIKQQIQYPEILAGTIDSETKLAQRLGFWSIPPKNLQEFRVRDLTQRTYRANQG